MGNQNCCVRPDNPSKTLGNLDTINDEQPETAPQNMQITENVINLETPVLEEKENQAVVKASKKGKVHNDLLEKPVEPITVTTVKQENVGEPEPASLYWNQKNGDIEDLIFDISDPTSDKIFDLFNEVRTKPGMYIDKAKEYKLEDIFEKAVKNDIKPSFLCKNESFYYALRDIVASINFTPKPESEMLDEIKRMPYFDKYEAIVYVTDAEIDHCEEAVWNLLKQVDMVNNSAFEDLLGKKMDFCTICAMPVKNSFLLKVYFVILKSKLRMSQMNFK